MALTCATTTTNSIVVDTGTPEQLTVVRPTLVHWRHLVPHDVLGERPLHAGRV